MMNSETRWKTTIGYIESFATDMDDFIGQENGDKVYYTESANGSMEIKKQSCGVGECL